jgi:hypothetical protein
MGDAPTPRDIRIATIVDERAGILSLARQRCRCVDAMVSRGTMTADAGEDFKTTINMFAGDIAIGLHVRGEDGGEVRAAMRAVVLAERDA